MYARNNASPRPITIGAVVQISDGAVQTTGVSVKVRKDAGAWGAGAGTLAAEEGIWSYTPTQGETDCDALQIIIYKTSCIPNSMEVVFTDAAEFGQVVLAGVTHTGAVVPTVSSVTNRVTANTDQWNGVAVTGMPMPTYTQPTGFLAATFPAAVASPTNITSASGVVLASTTHTGAVIPTVSTVTNGVTVTTNNDKTGYSLTTAPLTAAGTASAVWDALLTSYAVAGSFGARILRTDAASAGHGLKVTGSGHGAADIHELQPAVIDNTHFAAGAIDANALAADAATEIATAVGTLQVLTDLVTMITNDGTANARFSTSALQNAPGGGGSTTVNVLPYTGAVPDRVEGTTIKVFYNELTNVSVGVTDASGTAVPLDAKTLRFCVEDRYGVDVLTIADGSITRSGSTFTVQIPQSLTDTVGANYRWSLRDLTGSLNTVLIHGQMIVADAAEDEA